MKPIYVVTHLNQPVYHSMHLDAALRHVGTELNRGQSFGCMKVTAAEAVEAGYSIIKR